MPKIVVNLKDMLSRERKRYFGRTGYVMVDPAELRNGINTVWDHNINHWNDISVKISKKSNVDIEGNDIVVHEKISAEKARYGGDFEVVVTDGVVHKIKLHPDIQDGDTYTVAGQGLYIHGKVANPRGDVIVVLEIDETDSQANKTLFKEIRYKFDKLVLWFKGKTNQNGF